MRRRSRGNEMRPAEPKAAMNFLDLLFCIISGYFLLRGVLRGFVLEIAGIGGVVLGFFLANAYHLELAPVVDKLLDTPKWSATIAYLAIFVGCIVLVSLVARMLNSVLPSVAGWLNRFSGGMVGLVKGVLICLVIFLVASQYLPDSRLVTHARSAKFFYETAERLRPMLPDISLPDTAKPDITGPDNEAQPETSGSSL